MHINQQKACANFRGKGSMNSKNRHEESKVKACYAKVLKIYRCTRMVAVGKLWSGIERDWAEGRTFKSERGWPIHTPGEEITSHSFLERAEHPSIRSRHCPQPWGQVPNKSCWQIDWSWRGPPKPLRGMLYRAALTPKGHFSTQFKWTQLSHLLAVSAQQGVWRECDFR